MPDTHVLAQRPSQGHLAVYDAICRGPTYTVHLLTRTYRQPHRPDAHRWGLLIDLRGCAGDPTHALFSGQSQSIRDNVMALIWRNPSMELLGRELGTHWADFGNVEPNPNTTMPWSGRRLLATRLLTRAQW